MPSQLGVRFVVAGLGWIGKCMIGLVPVGLEGFARTLHSRLEAIDHFLIDPLVLGREVSEDGSL